MINNCINFIQSFIFPQACIQCRQLTHRLTALCHDCEQQLRFNQQCCGICAAPISQAKGLVCATCQADKPAYHSSRIPLVYSEPVNHWIRDFKFHNNLVKGKVLAELFLTGLQHTNTRAIDCLIPVPLHPSRIRQRGYNQALWLANQIGRHTGIPVDNRLVSRNRKTPPQHSLQHKQRLTNLNKAFELTRQCQYDKVVIVDDVVTTGSTANEIARLLATQAIRHIEVWAIARTANPK